MARHTLLTRHTSSVEVYIKQRTTCTEYALYEDKHIQELDRSPRVMNILTFATRLKMEIYRRLQAHRWVKEELFNKVQAKGSWYLVT